MAGSNRKKTAFFGPYTRLAPRSRHKLHLFRASLTRLKDPKEITKPDYHWTENVLDWATSLEEVKDKLTKIYPSAKNQWEEWKSQGEGESESYIWGQIPSGPRFEFTIHLQPFPWLSVHTTDSEEVIKLGQRLGLSVLDVQSGTWIYVQDA